MPIPLEIASQLIDEINAMVQYGVDIERLQLVRTEAEKLEKVNYVAGKRVKGMIASLKWDRSGVDHEFSAAINASGGDWTVFADYAAALANLHALKSAVDMIDEAVSRTTGNLPLLLIALELHVIAYDVSGARELYNHLRSLDALDAQVSKLDLMIDAIEGVLDNSAATWQEVCERIWLASNALSQLGLPINGRVTSIDEEGIFYRFLLSAPAEQIADATSKMLDAIADVAFTPADRAICFSCEQSDGCNS